MDFLVLSWLLFWSYFVAYLFINLCVYPVYGPQWSMPVAIVKYSIVPSMVLIAARYV